MPEEIDQEYSNGMVVHTPAVPGKEVGYGGCCHGGNGGVFRVVEKGRLR